MKIDDELINKILAYGFRDSIGHPLENCVDFINLYQRLVDAEEQLSRFQWQPIETAPKDGTEILLFGCYSKYVPTIGFWGGSRPAVWKDARLGGRTVACMPTHWMPLPEAPEADHAG